MKKLVIEINDKCYNVKQENNDNPTSYEEVLTFKGFVQVASFSAGSSYIAFLVTGGSIAIAGMTAIVTGILSLFFAEHKKVPIEMYDEEYSTSYTLNMNNNNNNNNDGFVELNAKVEKLTDSIDRASRLNEKALVERFKNELAKQLQRNDEVIDVEIVDNRRKYLR